MAEKTENGEVNNESEQQAELSPVSQDIKNCLQRMGEYDQYWRDQSNQIYELKLDLTNPMFVQFNHIRQVFRFYIIPALEGMLKQSVEKQTQLVSFYGFLFNEEKMNQFMKHFYNVTPDKDGKLQVNLEDPFDRDAKILFDLYKVKRQINGVTAFYELLEKSSVIFPSEFSKTEQLDILNNIRKALLVIFQQSLKKPFQAELFKKISLEYIDESMIEKRRKADLLYSVPETIEASPYRRVFMHIIFRNRILTCVKGRKTEITYSLADTEKLVKEYLDYFSENKAGETDASALFHHFHVQGKLFSECVFEEPDPEKLLYEDIDELKAYV